ncbi:MAG: hypothetical protein GY937_07805 [bacterium]|nr:hypothetical protein [bacterium]
MDRLRAVRWLLGAALLGLAVHLVVGEKPWEGEAAELVRQGRTPYLLDLARIHRYWISLGNLVVVALPCWALLLGIGLETAFARLRPPGTRRWLTFIALALFWVAYSGFEPRGHMLVHRYRGAGSGGPTR